MAGKDQGVQIRDEELETWDYGGTLSRLDCS